MITNKLTFLIAENDSNSILQIKTLLNEINGVCNGVAYTTHEIIGELTNNPPDVLLLNEDLGGAYSCFEILEQIQHLRISVILTTGSGKLSTFERTQKVGSVGYLVQPLERYSFCSMLNLLVNKAELLNYTAKEIPKEAPTPFQNDLFFKTQGILKKVPIEDILFLEAAGIYSHVITVTEKYLTSLSMTSLAKQIQKNNFMRIHRKFSINLSKISGINVQENLIYIDSHQIPIGRTKKAELIKIVNKHYIK